MDDVLEVRVLVTDGAKRTGPFDAFYDAVRDKRSRAAIQARLLRLRGGNLGDWKAVGDGVFELRIDLGPGYRIYCARIGNVIILLLNGGDKRTQSSEIDDAIDLWKLAKHDIENELEERTRNIREGLERS
jgi:putative addiction module killer protein